MVQNRERQPHNQLRLIVSLCWHVCWVLHCWLPVLLLHPSPSPSPSSLLNLWFSVRPLFLPSCPSLSLCVSPRRGGRMRLRRRPFPAAPPFSRRVQISYQRVTEAVPIALAAPTLPFFLWRGLVLGGAGTTGGRGCGLWVLVSLAAWLAD